MRVKHKLFGGFIAVLVLTVLIAALSLSQMILSEGAVNYLHHSLSKTHTQITTLYLAFNDADEIAFAMTDKAGAYNPDSEKLLHEKLELAQSSAQTLRKDPLVDKKQLEDTIPLIDQYAENCFTRFLPALAKGDKESANQICYEATKVKLILKFFLHIFYCVTVIENNMSKKYRTYFERY